MGLLESLRDILGVFALVFCLNLIVTAGGEVYHDYEAAHPAYYSLKEHPLQTKEWYQDNPAERFEYRGYGNGLIGGKMYEVRRFCAQDVRFREGAHWDEESNVSITSSGTVSTYPVGPKSLGSSGAWNQSQNGSVVQLITYRQTENGREVAVSLKLIDFDHPEGLNEFEQ